MFFQSGMGPRCGRPARSRHTARATKRRGGALLGRANSPPCRCKTQGVGPWRRRRMSERDAPGERFSPSPSEVPAEHDLRSHLPIGSAEILVVTTPLRLPISLGPVPFPRSPPTAGGLVDCGEPGYGYRYQQPELRLNVFVRKATEGTTDVRVTVRGRVLRIGNIGATSGQSEWRTCYSHGGLEAEMLEAVARMADGTVGGK